MANVPSIFAFCAFFFGVSTQLNASQSLCLDTFRTIFFTYAQMEQPGIELFELEPGDLIAEIRERAADQITAKFNSQFPLLRTQLLVPTPQDFKSAFHTNAQDFEKFLMSLTLREVKLLTLTLLDHYRLDWLALAGYSKMKINFADLWIQNIEIPPQFSLELAIESLGLGQLMKTTQKSAEILTQLRDANLYLRTQLKAAQKIAGDTDKKYRIKPGGFIAILSLTPIVLNIFFASPSPIVWGAAGVSAASFLLLIHRRMMSDMDPTANSAILMQLQEMRSITDSQ